jgi:hypothetical protein
MLNTVNHLSWAMALAIQNGVCPAGILLNWLEHVKTIKTICQGYINDK